MTSTEPIAINDAERLLNQVMHAVTQFYRDKRPLLEDGRADVDGQQTLAALAALSGAILHGAPANIRGRELKEFIRVVRRHAGVDK